MFEEIECVISGKVQNVMFRDFAQQEAKLLGIVGTAENLSNGTLRIIAQAMPPELKQYIERLHEGSVLARVEDVSVVWRVPGERFDDFHIVY